MSPTTCSNKKPLDVGSKGSVNKKADRPSINKRKYTMKFENYSKDKQLTDIEIKDKRMIVEALPTVDGCMLLLTVEDKKRKKYRLQNGKKCSCYDVGNSKNFLDVIQLLYKQNVCCNKNSAYEKDGVYYLIFDYPAVPKRFKRILHEYGVRCGDNIFAANLRENAQEICRSNAIAVIGKCL